MMRASQPAGLKTASLHRRRAGRYTLCIGLSQSLGCCSGTCIALHGMTLNFQDEHVDHILLYMRQK